MFAQKYLMKPLVAQCKEQLFGTITNENVFDIIKTSYFIDDKDTVETELMAAAPIRFHEILVQNLLSKNHVLLKGAALIKVRPLIPFLR